MSRMDNAGMTENARTVRFQCMSGEWREVEPLQVYKLETAPSPTRRNPERVIHEAFAEEQRVESLEAFIELGLRILAAEPFYLRKDSIPWMMTYVRHLGDEIKAGALELGRHRSYALRSYLWEKSSFIYLTRFVGALDFLACALYSGAFWSGSDNEGDMYHLRGIVNNESPGIKALDGLYELRSYFDDKQFKAELTRTRGQDSFIDFTIPDGEYLAIHAAGRELIYPSGAVGAGQIERFHLSEAWNSYGIAGYPGFNEVNGEHSSPFNIVHAVRPLGPHNADGVPVIAGEFYGVTLYIPHEWIHADQEET
ncbi:TPA: hypothetical protein NIB55_004215 [Pseudomonas aeruginosa]|nr:hypothetical protein [Pseudomonas aeruginosa]